jgi:hypothetical protein
MMKVNLDKAALTAGIVWGGCMFVTTLAAVYFHYGESFLNAMASIYPGFQISVAGSVIGFIYGFLDAFVGVYIVAWVYRQLAKK